MKHLLNNLSSEEKNSIREQHAGGMKVMTENFSRLINAKSGEVKPLVSEQDEMDDTMVNKAGSGENLRASVRVTVKNLTKETEETINSKLWNTKDWNELLSKIESGEVVSQLSKDSRGYAVETIVKRENYSEGDSLIVSFTTPVIVTKLNTSNYSKDAISRIELSDAGTSGTNVMINCKVDGYKQIVAEGKTDKPHPIDEGDFIDFDYLLNFRK
jgi:hypothetical protein